MTSTVKQPRPQTEQKPERRPEEQPEWRFEPAPVPYDQALAVMEVRVQALLDKTAPDLLWFLEHPPLYTGGTSAKAADLLAPRFPVYQTGRGGQYTYHGPGQRVVYVMKDLRAQPDIRAYVYHLEEWIIRALKMLGITGERRAGRIGIWVDQTPYGRQGEAKIAAIGVRVKKWIAYHGISINVNPDLSHYSGIVPCGIADHDVTSLHDLGVNVEMKDLDAALQQSFPGSF